MRASRADRPGLPGCGTSCGFAGTFSTFEADGDEETAGDPNNPVQFRDDATADELRAEIMKRIATLQDAGLIDLQALPAPDGETVRQVRRGGTI